MDIFDEELALSAKRITIKIAAIIEIVSGLTGIVLLLYQRFPLLKSLLNYTDPLLILFCVFMVVAGFRLWAGTYRGFRLSMFFQGIQILTIASPLITYDLFLGLKLLVGVFTPSMVFRWDAGVKFLFYFHNTDIPWGIGLNLIPLIVFYFVYHEYRKVKKIIALKARDVKTKSE